MLSAKITEPFKKDLNKLIDSYELQRSCAANVADLKLIIVRSHSYNSLSSQISLYIKKIVSKKKWMFFKVGHNKYTRDVNKLLKHYSQEYRIEQLNQEVLTLKAEIREINALHDIEKTNIKSSKQQAINKLLKENAALVKKISDLVQLPKSDFEKQPQFMPKLAAIVDSISP